MDQKLSAPTLQEAITAGVRKALRCSKANVAVRTAAKAQHRGGARTVTQERGGVTGEQRTGVELELLHRRGAGYRSTENRGGARAVIQEMGGATGAQRTWVELELSHRKGAGLQEHREQGAELELSHRRGVGLQEHREQGWS